MNQHVKDVEQTLPMTSPYGEKTFYIRKCYDTYYRNINDTLSNRKIKINYITLTGTPGIGKSIYYIYFFQKYRENNPGITIVTASFNNDRKLKKCIVFEPSDCIGKNHSKIPEIKDAMYLYDGPPEMESPCNKMIAFSSPNIGWFNTMRKCNNHIQFYFPLWDLEELFNANKYLNLNLTEKDLKERFLLFGGCARTCLSYPVEFFNNAKSDLDEKIIKIKTYTILKDCLQSHAHNDFSHSLFFYVPVISTPK